MPVSGRVATFLVIAFACGCSAPAPLSAPAVPTAATPAAPAVPQYTVEQFLANTSVLGASFAPDNATVLASADTILDFLDQQLEG